MDFTLFLTTIGLIPYFVSRAFFPMFATALIARLGPGWESLADLVGVQLMADLPAVCTSDAALVVLGLGTLVEFVANKEPTLREWVQAHDAEIKGILATLMSLLLAYADGADATHASVSRAGAPSFVAFPWALAIGAVVWYTATWRFHIYDFLREMDEDDDLKLQAFLSWAEDFVGPVGMVFVVVFPLAAVAAAGAAVLGLYLIERTLKAAEKRREQPCSSCQAPVLPCAPHCPTCNTVRPSPMKVGVLGIIKTEPSSDPAQQAMLLTTRKRCSYCGTRLHGRGVEATCPACRRPAFENATALRDYLVHVDRAVPRTLVVLAALSAVPFAGVLVGVIYYRVTIVASVRQYTPLGGRILGRWAVRIVSLLLLALQPVPFFGAVSLPLMAMTNYWLFKRLVVKDGSRRLGPPHATAPSAGE